MFFDEFLTENSPSRLQQSERVTAARSLSAVAASDSAKGQSWLAIDGLA
jgi:hypothetical protein